MQFAIQEAIVSTVKSTVDAYGLQSLDGDAGKVEVHEDVEEIRSQYKQGDDVTFTATLMAKYAEGTARPSAADVVVDAEIVEEDVVDDAVEVTDATVAED